MVTEIVFGILAVAIIALQAYSFNVILTRYQKREEDLINRIMSRDYSQYVQAEVIKKAPQPVYTEEERGYIPD